MTKSTITRERIAQIANPDVWVKCTHEEVQELARMALAAMDSEPVAWTDEQELRDVDRGGCGYLFTVNPVTPHADERRIILLYRHAQPAVDSEFIPKNLDKALGVLGMAIPESREEFNFQTERWIQRLIDRVIRYADEFQEQPAPVVPVVPDEMTPEQAHEIGDFYGDPVDVFARGANWMRQHIIDSTLAAAQQLPGTEPATVPGKWIPVSERMPENKPGSYEYLVFETLNNRVSHDYWNVSSEGDDAFTPFWNHYGEHVTHWMPLPTAPQEVSYA